MKGLKIVASAFVAIGIILGGFLAHEGRYANAERVQLVEFRLDQKIQQDRYWWLKERQEKLRRAYPASKTMPEPVRDEYDNLSRELKDIEMYQHRK